MLRISSIDSESKQRFLGGFGVVKDKAKEAPLVDAMDAQMLMLAMPFVLEGLAHQELTRFNAGKRPRDQVADPFRPIIGAYNDYLHWYSMYRSRQQTEHQVARMDTKSEDLLTSHDPADRTVSP